MEEVLQLIDSLYVDNVDIKGLTDVAIRTVLNELDDPHTIYQNAERALRSIEPMRGNTLGIGISFDMLADTLYVWEAVPGGPAQKAGLMPGDKIIYINDTLVANVKMTERELNRRLRGEKGTNIDLRVLRRGTLDLQDFSIICGEVPIFSVISSYMVTENIGYIKLSHFGDTSVEEFKKAIQALKAEGMENLILDLINNSGGNNNISHTITNEFLEKEVAGKVAVSRVEWKIRARCPEMFCDLGANHQPAARHFTSMVLSPNVAEPEAGSDVVIRLDMRNAASRPSDFGLEAHQATTAIAVARYISTGYASIERGTITAAATGGQQCERGSKNQAAGKAKSLFAFGFHRVS
jgi:hypothetical protein